MKIPWTFPGIFGRGKSAPSGKRRPEIERLEDRLALTASTLSHDQWATQTFHLDDATIVGPQIVTPSQTATAQDMQSSSLIGLDKIRNSTSYRGNGYSVAVIDTGIDYRHAALGGAWGNRVIAGWDFANNDADPMDDNGHGTHVAGIIGSSDATYPGLASGVNFIALKVLGADGSGSFGNVEQALIWVRAHQAQYNIVAINLSLGSGNYTANPYTYLDDDFTALTQQGVFVAVASGNSYYSYGSQPGMAFPATSAAAVSVGAVWSGDFGTMSWLSGARDITTAADRITSFTQRSSALDLLAPGAMITSTYLNGQFAALAGTSMATPMVAGAAVIVHQAMDSLGKGSLANQANILSILQNTGKTINDGDDENDNVVNTGLNFKRIDVWAAVSSLGTSPAPNPPPNPGTNRPPVLGAIADQNVKAGQTTIVTLLASDPDGQPLTFSTQIESVSSQAYDLRLQYGLWYSGSYFTNSWGANEKWLLGANDDWFCILPNGEFRGWAGSMAQTLQPASLLASLGTAYYADPSLLWNASAPTTPDVSLLVVGNQLRITPGLSYGGSFKLKVTVSDGQATAARSFNVTVNNGAPVLQDVPDVTMKANQVAPPITLNATDSDGDPLTYGARLGGLSLQALQMKQKYALKYFGDYHLNMRGAQEKWLGSNLGQLILLPNGELRRWTGNMATTLTSKYLVATFDSSYYANPAKLWNAVQPTFSVVGNQLTITPPKNFLGTFEVEASVTDGQVVTRQIFTVTVTNQAPTLDVAATAAAASGATATLVLSGQDADGDLLKYQAKVALDGYQLRTKFGLVAWTAADNQLGMGEKWFKGKKGKTFFLLADGSLRQWTGRIGADNMFGNLVSRLDTIYFEDTELLTKAVKPPVTVSILGNEVRVTGKLGWTGKVVLLLTASDGTASATRRVVLNIG